MEGGGVYIKPRSKTTSYILFSEGGYTMVPEPAFFVRVWHTGFVDPGPAPAFFSHKFLHQRDILLSLVHFHSDIGYKIK